MRYSIGGMTDVGHHDGGVGRRLNEDNCEVLSGTDGFVHLARVSGFHRDAADAKRAQEILDQVLRAAVDGDGVNDVLSGVRKGEKRGDDGGHAGVETQGRVRARFERDHARFQDLGIGVIEARVDQVGLLANIGLCASGDQIEGAFGRFRAGEDVSGTAENRGAGRSD